MKTCNTCGKARELTEFHSKSALCKCCKKIRDQGRDRNGDSIREVTEAARARKRRWASLHNDPIKNAARRFVRTCIISGQLTPPGTCEACNKPATRRDGVRAIQGHHFLGYENPGAVQWLCPKCHRMADAARQTPTDAAMEDKA